MGGSGKRESSEAIEEAAGGGGGGGGGGAAKRARGAGPRVEYEGFKVPRRGWRPEVVPADMEPRAFYERFVATRTPAVVRGHLADKAWKGAEWDDAYLKRRAGCAAVMVEEKGPSGGFGSGQPKVQMRFGELVDRLAAGETGLYLTTQPEDDEDEDDETAASAPLAAAPVSHLLGDFPWQPSLLRPLVPHQVNMWAGANAASGTSSGLHHDFHDNLYVLLRGAKRFTLFSPADAARLPTHGRLERVHRNGVFNYKGLATRADGAPEASFVKERLAAADRRVNELRELGDKADPEALKQAEQELDAALEAMLDNGGADGDNDEAMFAMGGFGEDGDGGDDDDDDDEEEGGFPDAGDDDDMDPEEAAAMAQMLGLAAGDDDDGGDDDDDEDGGSGSGHPDNFCVVDVPTLRRAVPYPDSAPSRDRPLEIGAGEGMEGVTPGVCELLEGDMLYLPAGWFHEVTSYGCDAKKRVHIAFNYWCHPPATSSFEAPYEDDFWQRQFEASRRKVEQAAAARASSSSSA